VNLHLIFELVPIRILPPVKTNTPMGIGVLSEAIAERAHCGCVLSRKISAAMPTATPPEIILVCDGSSQRLRGDIASQTVASLDDEVYHSLCRWNHSLVPSSATDAECKAIDKSGGKRQSPAIPTAVNSRRRSQFRWRRRPIDDTAAWTPCFSALMQSVFDLTVKSCHRWRKQQAAP
jgi:hypothetical protein